MRVLTADGTNGESLVLTMDAWKEKIWQAAGTEHSPWAQKLALEQQERLGGVARAKSAAEMVHKVVIGDATFTMECWVTRCGCRFAASCHRRLSDDDMSCGNCLRLAARQVETQLDSLRGAVSAEGRVTKARRHNQLLKKKTVENASACN